MIHCFLCPYAYPVDSRIGEARKPLFHHIPFLPQIRRARRLSFQIHCAVARVGDYVGDELEEEAKQIVTQTRDAHISHYSRTLRFALFRSASFAVGKLASLLLLAFPTRKHTVASSPAEAEPTEPRKKKPIRPCPREQSPTSKRLASCKGLIRSLCLAYLNEALVILGSFAVHLHPRDLPGGGVDNIPGDVVLGRKRRPSGDSELGSFIKRGLTEPASQGGEEVLVDVVGALCLRRTGHRLHRRAQSRGRGGGTPKRVELVGELGREAESSI
ncbi:uncharacterized protein G2W53_013332 [Senna tora]|uniref:Uncharacterized protein n=1 Tax=Senna tora TaxID=362788 RepID=A0A834U4F7_9FABA|nr:uncharacterized protein G2W53_013332 [Senna tora]